MNQEKINCQKNVKRSYQKVQKIDSLYKDKSAAF